METSEAINEIATALAKAQGEMGGALKSSANPFFKSKYADLASVREACQEQLSKHGIALIQSPSTDGSKVSVETLLAHSSGQWIKGTITVNAKDDTPQSVGSAISYCRRYALQSFTGVAPEDDDGEAAQGRGTVQKQQAQVPDIAPKVAPKGYNDWLLNLETVAAEGTDRLYAVWKESPAHLRGHLTENSPATWERIKAKAQKVAVPA